MRSETIPSSRLSSFSNLHLFSSLVLRSLPNQTCVFVHPYSLFFLFCFTFFFFLFILMLRQLAFIQSGCAIVHFDMHMWLVLFLFSFYVQIMYIEKSKIHSDDLFLFFFLYTTVILICLLYLVQICISFTDLYNYYCYQYLTFVIYYIIL